jgi:SM-20-related protein
VINAIAQNGFYVSDEFLSLEHFQQLHELLQSWQAEGQFKAAKIGLNATKTQAIQIRGDEIAWLDAGENHPAIKAYFTAINAVKDRLNQAFFLSLTDYEAHFAIYPPQSFYKKHVDQFKTANHRQISCVYYLNPQWQASFGGELNLYTAEDELLSTILPLANRFVCFKSNLPHEVLTSHYPRYSIAGWLKTRSHAVL